MKKVFLGGTCNESKWRSVLIPMLNIDYFNPVVDDWTEDCMDEEIYQRESCDFCLYVITSEMTGVYSIAEVVDDSNKRPGKTLFAVFGHGFSDVQKRSLSKVIEMVRKNGAETFHSLEGIAKYLNGK